MSTRDRERWNEKYASVELHRIAEPDDWLVEALQIIETTTTTSISNRRALDVACGLGHNAVWLARQGWTTDGVDISTTGLERARQSAAANGVHVGWTEADLDNWSPRPNEYDVVIVFRFLDRQTVPRVVQTALRPMGWLVYETFSSAQCKRPDNHIRNPDFTLAEGEFSTFFPQFDVVAQREDVLADRTVERFLGRLRASGKA
jgi:2-polyprenyl-3-methyl-5-hydroxy-6-metoxy-1,4-benzoquinol methylase